MGKLGCFLLRGFRLLVPLLLNSSLLGHDAVPFRQAGAQHSQSPIDVLMGGDTDIVELPPSRRCSILLTFEKLTNKEQCEIQLRILRHKFGQCPHGGAVLIGHSGRGIRTESKTEQGGELDVIGC